MMANSFVAVGSCPHRVLSYHMPRGVHTCFTSAHIVSQIATTRHTGNMIFWKKKPSKSISMIAHVFLKFASEFHMVPPTRTNVHSMKPHRVFHHLNYIDKKNLKKQMPSWSSWPKFMTKFCLATCRHVAMLIRWRWRRHCWYQTLVKKMNQNGSDMLRLYSKVIFLAIGYVPKFRHTRIYSGYCAMFVSRTRARAKSSCHLRHPTSLADDSLIPLGSISFIWLTVTPKKQEIDPALFLDRIVRFYPCGHSYMMMLDGCIYIFWMAVRLMFVFFCHVLPPPKDNIKSKWIYNLRNLKSNSIFCSKRNCHHHCI